MYPDLSYTYRRISYVHLPSLFDLSNSYDGSQFVKEVTADYVVWEFNGRIDYGYNSTAAEVNTHHAGIVILCSPMYSLVRPIVHA